MILGRFDRSEQHDSNVAAIKNYTREMSRGNLKVAAMKRSELETRLGTPFAMSGESIFATPERAATATKRRGRGRSSGGDGSRARRAASVGAFGVGAFDTPAGVAKPGSSLHVLSMPVLPILPALHPLNSLSPETEIHGHAVESGGSELPLSGPKPIWQRDPHEHWKPPSHHLRNLERAATSPGQKRARGGFPNKYLYPIEVSGLDTLFPE